MRFCKTRPLTILTLAAVSLLVALSSSSPSLAQLTRGVENTAPSPQTGDIPRAPKPGETSQDGAPVATAAPIRPDWSVHGTWEVTWTGFRKAPAQRFGIVRFERKGEKLSCTGGPCRYVVDNAPAAWQMHGAIWGHPISYDLSRSYTQEQPAGFENLRPDTVTAGRVQFDPPGAPETLLRLSAGRHIMRGRWRDGKETGQVVARRVLPALSRVDAKSDIETTARPGQAARIERTYDPFWWGESNTMLGNRPGFSMRVFGNRFTRWQRAFLDPATRLEISDIDPIFGTDAAGKRAERVIGYRISIATRPGVQPGRYTLHLDTMPVPFDLVVHKHPANAPELRSLAFSSLDRKPTERLDAATPFRVVASFAGANAKDKVFAEVPGTGGLKVLDGGLGGDAGPPRETRSKPETITLFRTDNPAIFESVPLILKARGGNSGARPETGAGDRIDDEAGARLAGTWQVAHRPDSERLVRGVATVSKGAETATLTLGTGDGQRSFRSRSINAEMDSDEKYALTTTIRFEELPKKTKGPGANLESRAINVAPRAELFTVTLEDELADAPVIWPETKHVKVQLLMPSDLPDQLSGAMREDKSEGFEATLARQVWIRGKTEILGIEVVEDQLARIAPGTEGVLETVEYPFDRSGRHIGRGSRERTLFVYGRGLPQGGSAARALSLDDDDATLAYKPYDRSGAREQKLLDAGWKKAAKRSKGKVSPSTHQATLVIATLSPGVTPGTKSVRVNGDSETWPLLFNDQFATLRFVRDGETAEDLPKNAGGDETGPPAGHVFFPDDIGTIELDYASAMPFGTEIEARLMHENGDTIGALTLTRDDEDATVYRGEPVNFLSAETKPKEELDGVSIAVAPGDVILAEMFDRAQAITRPTRAHALIEKAREDDDTLWIETLRRVAACKAGDNPEFKELASGSYARKTSEEFSNFIFDTARRNILAGDRQPAGDRSATRTVSVSNGDHAAAILIRDEFLTLMKNQAIPANRTLATRNGVRAFRAQARRGWTDRAYDRFWYQEIPVETGVLFDKEIALSQTLNEAQMARQLEIPIADFRAWAELRTRMALDQQHTEMNASLAFAEGAGDCDVERLMAIAGHRSVPVIPRILPRLVRPEERNRRMVWVADQPARGYVRSLYVKGASIAAQDAFASLDKAVIAMRVAAVSLPAIGAASLAGAGTSATIATTAVAAGDIAVGALGVDEYLEGEAFYEFARGGEAVLGADYADAADAKRQSAVMAAVGVLAPGLSPGAAAWGKLRNLKNVQSGRALVQGRPNLLDDLDALDEAEHLNVASYYTDLKLRAERNGVNSLTAADREAFDTFNDILGPRATTETATVPTSRASPAPDDSAPTLGGDTPTFETVAPPKRPDGGDAATVPPPENLPPTARAGPVRETGIETIQKTRSNFGAEDPFKTARWDPPEGAGNAANTGPARTEDSIPTLDTWRPPAGSPQGSGADGPAPILETPTGPGAVRARLDENNRITFEHTGGQAVESTEQIGRGATSRVFEVPGQNQVIKVTRPVGDTVLLDESGRRAVELVGDPDVVSTPRLVSRYRLDGDLPVHGAKSFEGGTVSVFERGPDSFKNMAESGRLPLASDGGMTAGQAIALDRAQRALNKNKFAWLDNKWDNYSMVPVGNPADDNWRVVILDPGGVVPMKTAEDAFNLQAAAANPPPGSSVHDIGNIQLRGGAFRSLLADQFDSRVDWARINSRTGRTSNGDTRYRTLDYINDQNEVNLGYLPVNAWRFPKTSGLAAAAEGDDLVRARNALRQNHPPESNLGPENTDTANGAP